MRTGRPKAASVNGDHRLRVAARSLAPVVLLALALLLRSGAGHADPASQLTVAQSGVRLRLGMFALGVDWVTMTVIVQNERDHRVWLAARASPDGHDTAEAVLSDEHGKSCKAATNPGGIAKIPALPEGKPTTVRRMMTEVPPHSSTNVVFDFPRCRLSRTSLLSLAATFGLSTDGREIEEFPIKFWGVVQKTGLR
jgi:hypothetical protein